MDMCAYYDASNFAFVCLFLAFSFNLTTFQMFQV